MSDTLPADELKTLVSAVPFWWHSIDLGGGVVTPGRKSAQRLEEELALCQLPDLSGRSVLDIGAWDGFFSWAAERLGAARVVALDHYVWSIDFSKHGTGRHQGPAKLAENIPEMWRPDQLPGKRGFDLARRTLRSRVEPVVADFMDTDLGALGQFDVVLYLGVLYHMRHPLLALERLAQVTRHLAVIETEAVCLPRLESHAWCEFFETDELAGDPSNWWAPNAKALVGLCRAAGFRQVDVLVAPDVGGGRFAMALRRTKNALSRRSAGAAIHRYRLFAHAYK